MQCSTVEMSVWAEHVSWQQKHHHDNRLNIIIILILSNYCSQVIITSDSMIDNDDDSVYDSRVWNDGSWTSPGQSSGLSSLVDL